MWMAGTSDDSAWAIRGPGLDGQPVEVGLGEFDHMEALAGDIWQAGCTDNYTGNKLREGVKKIELVTDSEYVVGRTTLLGLLLFVRTPVPICRC